MRLTQGTFSFLPDLTDEQIRKQLQYAINRGWAIGIELTDDPHPRNTYWEMWATPFFDVQDPDRVLQEIKACRAVHPQHYIRVSAFDSTRGWETVRLSFLVQRPEYEPGFRLDRTETRGRMMHYTIRPYATDRPAGARYARGG